MFPISVRRRTLDESLGQLSPTTVMTVNTSGHHVINQPVAARLGFTCIHAAKLASRCSIKPQSEFGTTQATLSEAAHEWRTQPVDGVCYEPVPVAESSPLAIARSAIR